MYVVISPHYEEDSLSWRKILDFNSERVLNRVATGLYDLSEKDPIIGLKLCI